MNLENSVCRKVYEHHDVLKGELGATLVEVLTRAKLDKNSLSTILTVVNGVVDTSSSKMTEDYQRFFSANK